MQNLTLSGGFKQISLYSSLLLGYKLTTGEEKFLGREVKEGTTVSMASREACLTILVLYFLLATFFAQTTIAAAREYPYETAETMEIVAQGGDFCSSTCCRPPIRSRSRPIAPGGVHCCCKNGMYTCNCL